MHTAACHRANSSRPTAAPLAKQVSIGVEDAAAVRALGAVANDVERDFSAVRTRLTIAHLTTRAVLHRHVAHLDMWEQSGWPLPHPSQPA